MPPAKKKELKFNQIVRDLVIGIFRKKFFNSGIDGDFSTIKINSY